MNKIKIALAIVGLILIGFVAGFSVHRQMSQKIMHKLIEMREPEGFKEHFMDRLELNEAQRGKVLPVLEKYSPKISELHRTFRKDRHELVDSMHQEIKPHLNADQVDMMERFGKRFRTGKNKKNRKKMPEREKKQE